MYLKAFACLTKGKLAAAGGAGTSYGETQASEGNQEWTTEAIIDSIGAHQHFGTGAYVPRAQAEPITISGEDVKAEEGNEYGSGLNTEESINLSNGAIGNKDTGTASGNTLQVTGGTVTSENPGSNIFGGVIIHEDNTTTSTEDQVNGNTVTLGSTTLGSGATEYDGVSIFGGYLYDYTKEYLGSEEENENHLVSTEQFDVSGNTVTLEKGHCA